MSRLEAVVRFEKEKELVYHGHSYLEAVNDRLSSASRDDISNS